MLSGSPSCSPCPVPGSREGSSRGCWAVPGRCCRWPSAATSRPQGGAVRGGCAVPGAADGKPPPAFRYGIAVSLRFWRGCPCLQGLRGSQPSWVLLLAADLSHRVFSYLHHAIASFLFAVCSFWVSWPLRSPSQRMTNTNSLEAAGQQRYQEVSWLLPSGGAAVGGAGARLLSLFPLVAVHSSSQLHWPSQSALDCSAGAWTPEQGVPHSCARAACWHPGSGQPTVTC